MSCDHEVLTANVSWVNEARDGLAGMCSPAFLSYSLLKVEVFWASCGTTYHSRPIYRMGQKCCYTEIGQRIFKRCHIKYTSLTLD